MTKIRTILMADDDDDDFFLFSHALKKCVEGAQLSRVKDGVETIDYLTGNRVYGDRRLHPLPGLLVLDIKMPRKNGFEVLAWVRSQDRLQGLLVVVLSSSNEPRDVQQAYEMGANSYLAKPTNFDFYSDLTRSLVNYWLNWNEAARLF
jgi:CheY-like chemotaxis protein